jgi:hypothetical protein
MRFSILHISDLHRDLTDEINNKWLLDSLEKDFGQFGQQEPAIAAPTLCIASGDIVYGVKAGAANAASEMKRQYQQSEEFLAGLADRFFGGDHDRIVILPGNHDVFFDSVMASSVKIPIPAEADKKAELVSELFRPNSRLRWSWRELCFYRIFDRELYEKRFEPFAETYASFYAKKRNFSLVPQEQFDIFDFPDLGFCLATLNSCFNNDPLRRAGAFEPTALTNACRKVRESRRAGWVVAASWHHNVAGGPALDDYLDTQFLQLLIDAGVSLGFHGHQHMPECFDERYRIGPSPRKLTIISASTLCSDPHNLKPGVPRSYNIVELDTDLWKGRVHQRQMINMLFSLPVWGPGHFTATNRSYFDFDLCKPQASRPPQLDLELNLERADKSLGARQWQDALNILEGVREQAAARPLILKALSESGDARRTIAMLWPPQTVAEIVTLGGAVLEAGSRQEAEAFVQLLPVADCADASVKDMAQRIRERRLR